MSANGERGIWAILENCSDDIAGKHGRESRTDVECVLISKLLIERCHCLLLGRITVRWKVTLFYLQPAAVILMRTSLSLSWEASGIGKEILVSGLPISVRPRAVWVAIVVMKCDLVAWEALRFRIGTLVLESLAVLRIFMGGMRMKWAIDGVLSRTYIQFPC